MSTTHHGPRTGAAWVFPVVNFAGRLTTAEIRVTRPGLIVVSTPDGGSFAVDPDSQFNQFNQFRPCGRHAWRPCWFRSALHEPLNTGKGCPVVI
jgi:hypothetical protein